MSLDKPDLQFSSNGYIEKNMQDLKNYLVDEGTDQMVILVIGSVNTAKTSLSMLIDYYLNDGEINLDTYCHDHDKFIQEYTSRPLNKTIVYEEGRDSFYRRKAMSKNNTEAMDKLNQYRKYQHVVFINFQNIRDLEPDLAISDMAHGLFRCVKPGWCWFYSQKSMKQMFDKRDFTGWDKPDFKDSFRNPEDFIPDLWSNYERKAVEKLDSKEEEPDKGKSLSEMMSTGDVADMLSVSNATVRNWCDSGKLESKKLPNGDRRIPEKSVKEVLKD